jgi:hypothetical protein
MDNVQNTNDTLDSSLISDELINITSELTEVGIDSFFQEGILKDVPIIGTLVSLTKIGANIKDKLFLKKMLRFLYQLKEISSEKRKIFIEKINNEKKFKTKVGETLILLINKVNDYTKADFLGMLFAAAVQGDIDYKIFLKLANIVDQSHLPDLDNLLPIYQGNNNEVEDVDKDILYNLGLLASLGIDGRMFMYQDDEKVPNKKNQFEINKYGKLIVELLLLPKKNNK